MPKKTATAAGASSPPAFDPSKLSPEDQAAVVEAFLGAHPDYFIYEAGQIKLDIYKLHRDGKQWNGWIPHRKQLGY